MIKEYEEPAVEAVLIGGDVICASNGTKPNSGSNYELPKQFD